MGGKSFEKPASRLTTPELDKLTSYCQKQLVEIFPRTERLRCITSKSSHGDLDLLRPFDRLEISIGQSQVGLSSDNDENGVDEDGNVARVRAFCDDVSDLLGANGWVIAYYGYPIIAVQLPFRQVDQTTGGSEQSFWQVDVALTPMGSYDAYLFSCSYNIPFALLVLATQSISPVFWLKRDGLCLRHRPYFGQPFVEITLISNHLELYDWLGLDMTKWHAGFEDYECIYKWITTNPTGSALAEAWDRMAAGYMDGVKVEYKRHHTRIDGIPEFVDWLKTRRPVHTSNPAFPNRTSLATDSTPGEGDTAQEIPLDDIAMRLLIESGKLPAYEEAVKPKRTEAERIVQMHEKRKANRVRAAMDEERGRATRAALALEAATAKLRLSEEGGQDEPGHAVLGKEGVVLEGDIMAEGIPA